MRVTYGYIVKGPDDPFVVAGIAADDQFSEATRPGVWPVDFVPLRTCHSSAPMLLIY